MIIRIILFLILLTTNVFSDSLRMSGVTVSGIAVNGDIHAFDPRRILPLGDSITRGVSGSTDSMGYRNNLQDLFGIGYYDFVGPYTDPISSATYDVNHSGVGGQRTDQISSRTMTSLTGYLPSRNYNSIVLLIAGTNDMLQSIATATAVTNATGIVDIIHNYDASIDIYVGLIPPNTNSTEDAKIVTYNSSLNTALQTLQATYTNLVIVDFYSMFTNNTFGTCPTLASCMDADGIHPNDTGYAAIASQWYSCINSKLNTNCNGN